MTVFTFIMVPAKYEPLCIFKYSLMPFYTNYVSLILSLIFSLNPEGKVTGMKDI